MRLDLSLAILFVYLFWCIDAQNEVIRVPVDYDLSGYIIELYGDYVIDINNEDTLRNFDPVEHSGIGNLPRQYEKTWLLQTSAFADQEISLEILFVDIGTQVDACEDQYVFYADSISVAVDGETANIVYLPTDFGTPAVKSCGSTLDDTYKFLSPENTVLGTTDFVVSPLGNGGQVLVQLVVDGDGVSGYGMILKWTSSFHCYGGMVLGQTGSYSCDCSGTGRVGERCETSLCDNWDADTGTCNCTGTGHIGEYCDVSCAGGSTVQNSIGEYVCDCTDTASIGRTCETSCQGGVTLETSIGDYICDCGSTGRTGSVCELTCAEDYYQDPNNREICDCGDVSIGGALCGTVCENGGRGLLEGFNITGSDDLRYCDCSGTFFDGNTCTSPLQICSVITCPLEAACSSCGTGCIQCNGIIEEQAGTYTECLSEDACYSQLTFSNISTYVSGEFFCGSKYAGDSCFSCSAGFTKNEAGTCEECPKQQDVLLYVVAGVVTIASAVILGWPHLMTMYMMQFLMVTAWFVQLLVFILQMGTNMGVARALLADLLTPLLLQWGTRPECLLVIAGDNVEAYSLSLIVSLSLPVCMWLFTYITGPMIERCTSDDIRTSNEYVPTAQGGWAENGEYVDQEEQESRLAKAREEQAVSNKIGNMQSATSFARRNVILLSAVYLPSIRAAWQHFDCVCNGTDCFLRINMSVACDTEQWQSLSTYAIMALLFSGIGIPVYFLFVFASRPTFLFIHKRIWLDDVQQALARCFKRKPTYAGVEQFEYEKALLLWGRKYGGLTLMFHETYSNWYIVLVARTVLIANAPYLLRPADQEGQALILGSILLLFTCIHLYCFPYQAHSLNQFELCCLLCALAFVAQTFLSVSAGAITSVSFEDYANAALLLIVMGALIYFSILAANKKYIQNADVRMQVLRVLMFQSSCQAVPMVEIEDLKDYNYMYPQHYTNIILPRHTEALTDFSLAPAVTKNNGACKEHTADIPIVKPDHLGSAKSCPADALIACNHVQELYFAMSAGRPKSHSVYELFTQCVMKTGTPVTEPEKSDAVNKYVQKHPNVFRGIHMSDLAYCELMVQLYAANQNIRAPRSLKPVFVVALTIAACASAVTGFSWFGAVMAGTVLLGFLVQIWLIRASHRAVSSEVATFSAIVKAALLAAEEMSPVEAEAAIEFDVGFLWKAYSPPKLIQEKVWFFLTQPLRPNVPWMYFTVEVEEFKVEKKKSTKNAGSSQSKKKSTKRAAAKKKRKTAIAKKAARAAKKQQNLKKALAIMQKVTHLSAQKKSHKKNNMSAADLELDLLEEKAARAVIAEQNLVSESEKQAVQDLYLQHREAKLAVKANNMRPGKKRRDTLQLVQDALVGGNAPGPTEGLNIFEALEAEAEELRQLKSKLKGLSEPAVEANLPGQMYARDRAQEDLRSRSVMIRDVEGMMNPALLASYTQGQAGRKAKNKKTKGKPNMSKRSIMINQMNSSLMIQSSITE